MYLLMWLVLTWYNNDYIISLFMFKTAHGMKYRLRYHRLQVGIPSSQVAEQTWWLW